MKVLTGSGSLELSRRNLTALLAKLDGHPAGSLCTIVSTCGRMVVKAVEDAEHYGDREPGGLHPATLTRITG